MTWNETPLSLAQQGVPVKFANPKEGALTWCCGLVLLKDAPQVDKAHQLIDADLVARGLSKKPLEIVNRGTFAGVQEPEADQMIATDHESIRAGF